MSHDLIDIGLRPGDAELIRLLEADKAEATGFLRSVLTTAVAVRTTGFTAWLTLLGFGIDRESPWLAALAALVVITFGVVDAYHGWLYTVSFRRVRAVEDLLGRYYSALSLIDDDPDSIDDFRRDLYAHRYGTYAGFEKFGLASLVRARPQALYQYLYPTIAGVALITGVILLVV